MSVINNLFNPFSALYNRLKKMPPPQKKRGYVVGTGWWCDGSGTHAGAELKHNESTDFIRDKDFFNLWYHFVNKYTNPDKIIVMDSASPVRPDLPDDSRIEFLSVKKNWGHFRDCDVNEMCGVERAHLGCAFYSFLNDCDLVYVEQDCIVVGEGWVERCMKDMTKGKVMYGHGRKTPQPIQQSLAIVRWEYLPTFINKLIEQFIEHSPQVAKNGVLAKHNTEHRWHDAFKNEVDYLPIGYGRARPLNFDDPHFYAQHWTEEEITQLFKRENIHKSQFSL